MSNEEDVFKRLEEAGIIKHRGDLSPQARHVLGNLSEEEVDCLFSVRQKISEASRERYDAFIHYDGF